MLWAKSGRAKNSCKIHFKKKSGVYISIFLNATLKFLLFFPFIVFICMCVPDYLCVYHVAALHVALQTKVLEILELELQVVNQCVHETETRPTSVPNNQFPKRHDESRRGFVWLITHFSSLSLGSIDL